MAKPGSVVCPESMFFSGRRNDVGAVDGRMTEKGFVMERKWVSRTLGKNGGRKVNILCRFPLGLHPWKCSCGFEGGHPWRWIAGRLGLEESFKGVNGSGAGSSDVVEALAGAGSSTSNEALSMDEVAGMGNVEGRNCTVLPKRVPLVSGA